MDAAHPVNAEAHRGRNRDRQLATALTVRHGASSSIRRTPPQARHNRWMRGRGHPVNDSEVTEVTDRDRQPVTALTVIMALIRI